MENESIEYHTMPEQISVPGGLANKVLRKMGVDVKMTNPETKVKISKDAVLDYAQEIYGSRAAAEAMLPRLLM